MVMLGWMAAFGRLAETFAQDKKAETKLPDKSIPVVDGSVLPFPPTTSASTASLTMQDSIYKKRVEPQRLPKDAPNILIILMDDVGPGQASTYGGEINTPTLSRVSKAGISYNRFHSTAMCSPSRGSLLCGRNHTRIGCGQICELANDWDGFAGSIPKSAATERSRRGILTAPLVQAGRQVKRAESGNTRPQPRSHIRQTAGPASISKYES
jgi:hypothetical protein